MDDAVVVSFCESVGNLSRDFEGLFNLQPAAGELSFQRLAVIVCHNDEGLPLIGVTDVMDGANVWMFE